MLSCNIYEERSRGRLARPKIAAFRPIVLARLAEYPKLTATCLHAEVRAAGYTGGYTQLQEYVRPTPAIDPVVPFEIAPEWQPQVDFGEFRLPRGKRFALLVVLGYSRLLWMQFYPRQTMSVLHAVLSRPSIFGGVSAEMLFEGCDRR